MRFSIIKSLKNMKHKCIIIDNERHIIQLIKNYNDENTQLEIVKIFHNPQDVLSQISIEDQIDIAFLNIDLPESKGFDLAPFLSQMVKFVVVTSSEPQHAIKAFDFQLFDFLTKPVGPLRFAESIAKVAKWHEKSAMRGVKDDFFLRSVGYDPKWVKGEFEDLKIIESDRNHLKLTLSNSTYSITGSLTSAEKNLPMENFIRIHRSFIIGKKHIEFVENNSVKMRGVPKMLTIGEKFRQDFYNYLESINLLK